MGDSRQEPFCPYFWRRATIPQWEMGEKLKKERRGKIVGSNSPNFIFSDLLLFRMVTWTSYYLCVHGRLDSLLIILLYMYTPLLKVRVEFSK
jgi:hypothetical protein